MSAAAFPDRRQTNCANPDFIPCLPQGSESSGSPDVDPYGITQVMNESGNEVTETAGESIACSFGCKRDLEARQSGLCCNPDLECRVFTSNNIPFCYVRRSNAFPFR